MLAKKPLSPTLSRKREREDSDALSDHLGTPCSGFQHMRERENCNALSDYLSGLRFGF